MGFVFLLGVWLLCLFFSKASPKIGQWILMVCLAGAMGTQWLLLLMDGLFSVQTALPLHLCGLMALLSLFLLWKPSTLLWSLCTLLGVPCAFLALCFPAVAWSSYPLAMESAFFLLHASIVCVPFFLCLCGLARPTDHRMAMLWINFFLLLVSLVNAGLDTNYLFLRAAPKGTPLSFLKAQGRLFYVSSLEMLCLLVTIWLSHLYGRFFTARNS